MSKMADYAIEKMEALEKLRGQRMELIEAKMSLDPEANKVEIYEIDQKIAILNDQILTINQ